MLIGRLRTRNGNGAVNGMERVPFLRNRTERNGNVTVFMPPTVTHRVPDMVRSSPGPYEANLVPSFPDTCIFRLTVLSGHYFFVTHQWVETSGYAIYMQLTFLQTRVLKRSISRKNSSYS